MDKNWLTYRGLWALSLPSIVATMIEPISSIIDTALVGNFDTNSLAALAIGVSIISSLTWMFNFLVHAPIQKISSYLGSGNIAGVQSTIKFSFLLALSLGILLILFIYPIRFYIYDFMNVTEGFISETDEYFKVRLFGQFIILVFTVNLSVLRGFAKVNHALSFVSISAAVNVILSYLSLHVFGLGLFGVALSTVVGNLVALIISTLFILKMPEISKDIIKIKIDPEIKKSVIKASANIFGRSFFLTLCFFISTKMASYLGIVSLAAHQIVLQIWLFSSFFTDGVATTGNIICARMQNGDMLKLRSILVKLNNLGLFIGLVFCGVYLLLPDVIISTFTNDLDVVNKIKEIWSLIAIVQIPLSVAYVLDGHMFGLDKFNELKKMMIVAFFLIFLPIISLSYFDEKLLYIWLSLILVGLFRLITNFYFIERKLRSSL